MTLLLNWSLDHEPIPKICGIEGPASSAPLEAAELEQFSLNRLKSIPARFLYLHYPLEIVLLQTTLSGFT